MTPFTAIYNAAQLAHAAFAQGDDAAWEKHAAEVCRLTTLRLQQIRTGISTAVTYPVTQFEPVPDAAELDNA